MERRVIMRLSRALQSAAVAGILGLGLLGTSATPALADHVRTQCDRDGDYCWRIWCDRDWDDCHRIAGSGYRRSNSYYRYNRYGDYSGYYRNSYRRSYSSGGHWVCDSDGDDCHWQRSYDSYNRPY